MNAAASHALHPDDEAWVGDEEMYKAVDWADQLERERSSVVSYSKSIQENEESVRQYRQAIALLERMQDPQYKYKVQNRLYWDYRDTIRRGFLYIQNARRVVPNADPWKILRNTLSLHHGNHPTLTIYAFHTTCDFTIGTFVETYLLWLFGAISVWRQVFPNRLIASRVVQCLV